VAGTGHDRQRGGQGRAFVRHGSRGGPVLT
jgi:hypothetical protein